MIIKKLFAVLLLQFFVLSKASATLLDFDSHSATTLQGGLPPSAAVITDEYLSEGIVFGKSGVSAGVAVVSNPSTASHPNGICGLDNAGRLTFACSGDIYFSFMAGVDKAVTNAVSFTLGDSGTDLDRWYISVFDEHDSLLERRFVRSESNITESFSYANMHSFHIEWAVSSIAGYLFDDLRFNKPVSTVMVPEPSSLLLMMSALFGLVSLHRRAV